VSLAERRVTLAAVAGAHGLGGEVRLKLFGDGPEALRAYAGKAGLEAGDETGGRPLTLVSVRAGSGGAAVARFTELGDRGAAEALRGALLTVSRAALPPLGEGEYYHADLIGLPLHGPDGAVLGKVVGVENFGAGDLLDVETEGGRRALIPFRPGIADLDGDAIRADPAFLV
jgi:16S rRNA processing protein RimM